jgi:mRNA interferase RelE/StbE
VAKRVTYSREALRALQRIDRRTGGRIVLKVEQLASNPESLANNVRALKGPGGLKRLRVGDWRVIFTETLVVIAVQRIAPRGSAYDRGVTK